LNSKQLDEVFLESGLSVMTITNLFSSPLFCSFQLHLVLLKHNYSALLRNRALSLKLYYVKVKKERHG